MPFLSYLVRRTQQHSQAKQQQQQQQQSQTKRSVTMPTIKKKKEIGDYILGRTIGRGASGTNSIFNSLSDVLKNLIISQ